MIYLSIDYSYCDSVLMEAKYGLDKLKMFTEVAQKIGANEQIEKIKKKNLD